MKAKGGHGIPNNPLVLKEFYFAAETIFKRKEGGRGSNHKFDNQNHEKYYLSKLKNVVITSLNKVFIP